MASRAGLAALALTDHDCLDGLPEFHRSANGFEPVSGVEISARFKESDVHILGLFIDPDRGPLRENLKKLARDRERRAGTIVDRLRSHGVPIDMDHVRAKSPQGTLGRPHVAMALVEMGEARTVDDAFRRYLRPRTPGYVTKPGPLPAEAVEWIHQAGGAAVLAHPGILKRSSWIQGFAEAGLDGIEVWHPKHGESSRRTFLQMAERLNLVPSGGSDYHGPSVGEARIGQEPVPLECLERLRKRCSPG